MKLSFYCLALLGVAGFAAEPRAKNVILFLGDAGGIPTLNAAGIYGHNEPQSLFIHRMPHFALADTSALDNWVTDSAAGMTAIVTGQKTNNGMLSLLPGAEGAPDRPLKTILEYAEERGLATGVITNRPVWDATPAACWAHVNSRKSTGEIFQALLRPEYGDGVDIVIGADNKGVVAAARAMNFEAEPALREAGYEVFATPDAIPASASRATAIYDGDDFEPAPVVANAVQILARNPRGFFLMVEWDMHTNTLEKGLKRTLVMDAMIRRIAQETPADTLIIFAADHSFDLRLRGGQRGKPLAEQMAANPAGPAPVLRVDNGHTGEEILVAAQGPGAERLHGFIPNTRIFHLMMEAYGWPETP
jgi:alkaline phosphatase